MSKNDTQERLSDCLVQLLLTKRIEKIRIAELCEAAKISRRTFYLYYESIYDLLQEIEDDLLLGVAQSGDRYKQTLPISYDRLYELNVAVYKYILEHRDTFLALLGHHADMSFHYKYRAQIQRNFTKIFKSTKLANTNDDITFYFMASGNVETIAYWLETQSCSIEEFARTMQVMLYKAFEVYD